MVEGERTRERETQRGREREKQKQKEKEKTKKITNLALGLNENLSREKGDTALLATHTVLFHVGFGNVEDRAAMRA